MNDIIFLALFRIPGHADTFTAKKHIWTIPMAVFSIKIHGIGSFTDLKYSVKYFIQLNILINTV